MSPNKFLPLTFSLVLFVLGAGPARATPAKFAIPAQPAPAALMLFSQQAGVEVVYSYDDLSKVTANEVVGELEPDEAIARLLRGTGFSSRRNAAGKFVVVPEARDRGKIRGVIRQTTRQEPLGGARVGVPGTTLVTRSNDNGEFVLGGLPPGRLTIAVQADGFVPARISDVRVVNDTTTTVPPVVLAIASEGVEQLDDYRVSSGYLIADPVVALENFVVTPSRFGIAEERVTPNVTLTSEELETLPQLGEDLYRTIARVPGLAADDFSAKFWVRGAPNRQMLARFDGVDLIEPFHLKDFEGTLSIVDLQTISSIDLVTGGFTTEYGDRLAGVLTMTTQESNRPKPLTTLGLSVTNVRATNQGEFANGNGQWMVAARRGYLDVALKLGDGSIGGSPTYYDLSGKVAYRLNPHHALSLHLLYSGDRFARLNKENAADLRSSYDSMYLWGRWQGDFGERVSGESVLSLSRHNWLRDGDGLIDYGTHQFKLHDNRRLNSVDLRQDWKLNLNEQALVRTGFEFKSSTARYDYNLSRELWSLVNGELLHPTRTINLRLRPRGDYSAAYLAPRLQPWKALVIEPGLRFERHTVAGDSGWSPRFNASLALGPRTTVRAAWGIYEQGQGLHELSIQDQETTFHQAERAEQRVVGISHKLKSGPTLRLEAYERLGSHLRPHWETMIDPYNVFPEALYDRVRIDPRRGRARGIELLAEHRGGRFGWGASYAYAISEEEAGNRWIPRNRDQRHTFYADLTYSPARDWQLSCAWQYHTGWPTTDINFYLRTLNDGSLIYAWTYGPYNGGRTPAYHRLDLRATRTFRLKRSTLRVFADLFNAYNQNNEAGYDLPSASIMQGQLIVNKKPLKMFPILPSLGLSWEF